MLGPLLSIRQWKSSANPSPTRSRMRCSKCFNCQVGRMAGRFNTLFKDLGHRAGTGISWVYTVHMIRPPLSPEAFLADNARIMVAKSKKSNAMRNFNWFSKISIWEINAESRMSTTRRNPTLIVRVKTKWLHGRRFWRSFWRCFRRRFRRGFGRGFGRRCTRRRGCPCLPTGCVRAGGAPAILVLARLTFWLWVTRVFGKSSLKTPMENWLADSNLSGLTKVSSAILP